MKILLSFYLFFFLFIKIFYLQNMVFASSEKKTKTLVSVQKISLQDISDEYLYPAQLVSKVQAILKAEFPGTIQDIPTRLGQKVQSQTPVLTLVRNDPLYNYKPFSVVSPIEGLISGIYVNKGSSVALGDRLASVVDPSEVAVMVEIPQTNLHFFSTGSKGQFVFPISKSSGEIPPINVEVRGINPIVDLQTGTATGELQIIKDETYEKMSHHIHPGLVGKVSFRFSHRKGFLIPEESFVERMDEYFIRTVVDGKILEKKVQLANKRGKRWEVSSGPKEGDLLVLYASKVLKDGEDVEVKQ